MTKVAIIYDASYLMHGRRHEPLQDIPLLKGYNLINIVADETVTEILGKLKPDGAKTSKAADGAKTSKAASLARMVIADLKEGQTSRVTFREEAFAGTTDWKTGDRLGADSPVDKLLMGKAKALAEAGSYDAVLIASKDQGIRIDIVALRSKTRLPVFFIRDPRDRDVSFEVLRKHLAFGSSSGSWRPECVVEQPTAVRAYFSPAGPQKMLASIDLDRHTVRLWRFSDELLTGLVPIGSIRVADHVVSRCQFRPDGAMFLVCDPQPPVTMLWGPPAPGGGIADQPILQFEGGRFVVSRDGRLLAVLHRSGCRWIDMESREALRRQAPPPGPPEAFVSPNSVLMAKCWRRVVRRSTTLLSVTSTSTAYRVGSALPHFSQMMAGAT
jgi:hypothetical protein